MKQTISLLFSLLISCATIFAQTPAPTAPSGARSIVLQNSTLPTPQPAPVPVPDATPQPPALVFDAESKDYNPKPGEATAPFVFNLTNVSASEIIISNVTTSCGCTVAQLPAQPWHLAPGTNGQIKATMNLAGKMGHVTKTLTVYSSVGIKALHVNVTMPAPQPATVAENARGDRNKNMELAKADRQAVFKGDCRSCHVDKGSAKLGKELYAADCGICHDSPIRASMVPDLRAPKTPRNHSYWINWIAYGRPGSMMPAFGEKDGGPLSKEQIESLVTYLSENFPQGAVPTPIVAPAHPPLPHPQPGGSQ